MGLRQAVVQDYPAILRLNEDLVHFLSPMDEHLLAELHRQSELTQVIEEKGKIVAFLIALREGKQYGSENYLWFSQQYPKFLYVDRVVVDRDYHHCGYGKMMYNEIFACARRTKVPVVTAEVNIQPPNPVSLAFHKKEGFEEVGAQWLQGGKKQVALLAVKGITSDDPAL